MSTRLRVLLLRSDHLTLVVHQLIFFSTTRPPPRSTLFPYTTLFRSHHARQFHARRSPAGGVRRRWEIHLRLLRPCHLREDRKSTRLNSSHVAISYAVFCLKKKNAQAHRAVIDGIAARRAGELAAGRA